MNKLEREEEKTSEQRRSSYFNSLNMSVLLKLLIASSTEVTFFKLSTVYYLLHKVMETKSI